MMKKISRSKYFQSLVSFLYLVGTLFVLWLAYSLSKYLCSRKKGNAYNASKHRPKNINVIRQQKFKN